MTGVVLKHALSERGNDLYQTPASRFRRCCGRKSSASAMGAGVRPRGIVNVLRAAVTRSSAATSSIMAARLILPP